MKKFIQSTLIALILTTIPVYAQNSGPIAPEAASFEPIDATDMVDLLSGDFSYVLPLLEVPGPSGGYPISLHYHAGTTLDLEASWVGLGWNLNPGSILRSVNGVADDYNGKFNFTYLNDDGGEYELWSIGLGVGIPKVTNIGVEVSWDSNKTIGGGLSMGFGIDNTPMELNMGLNTRSGMNVGVGLNIKGFNPSFSFNEKGANIGVDYSPFNSEGGFVGKFATVGIGISMSSEGVSVNPSIMGQYSSSSSGKFFGSDYTVIQHQYKVPIYTPYFTLNVGHYYTKWYLKKLSSNKKYGPLYYRDIYDSFDASSGNADKFINMDVMEYPLSPDLEDESSKNLVTLPAYDSYCFSAQGINGYMTPRLFETLKSPYLIGTGLEMSKNKQGEVEEKLEFNFDDEEKVFSRPQFYFNYIHSSSFRIDEELLWKSYSMTDNPFVDYRTEDSGCILAESNYSLSQKRSITGNVVEWFTNDEIINNVSTCIRNGFIESSSIVDSEGRDNDVYFDLDGIGAFTIVKTDGLRYHYSLPVYQFETFQKSNEVNDATKYYLQIEPNKYATSWLLTSITGPDYVDVNQNGLIDDQDVGYWMKLDYGKWTDNYIWKKHKEISKIDNLTLGRKQIYYLNSIQTKSHIAYFIKDIRADGLGEKVLPNEVFGIYSNVHTYSVYKSSVIGNPLPEEYPDGYQFYEAYVNVNFSAVFENETPTLCLKKILLLKKDGDVMSEGISGQLCNKILSDSKVTLNRVGSNVKYYEFDTNRSRTYAYPLKEEFTYSYIPKGYLCHSENVYDILDEYDNFQQKAIKVIDFNYDNTLHLSHTKNSNVNSSQQGKLSLKRLEFLGIKGAKVMPPYYFDYYCAGEAAKDLKEDAWGFACKFQDDYSSKNEVQYGSLSDIYFPLGGSIHVNYESDKYSNPVIQQFKNEILYFDHDGVKSKTDVIWSDFNSSWKKLKVYRIEKLQSSRKWRVHFDCSSINIAPSHIINKRCYVNISNIYGPVTPPATVPVPIMTDIQISATDPFIINGHNSYVDLIGYVFNDMNGYSSEITFNEGEVIDIDDDRGFVYVEIDNSYEFNGGGLRTTSIEVKEGNKVKSKTNYIYPNNGITTQVPSELESFTPYFGEIPAAGVYYDKVIVQNEGENGVLAPVKTTYEFYLPNVFENNKLGEIVELPSDNNITKIENYPNVGGYKITPYTRSSILKDNKSAWGRLMSIKVENQQEEIVSKTEYHYLLPEDVPQGDIAETFKYAKVITDTKEKTKNWYFGNVIRKQYPNILSSVTTTTQEISKTVTNKAWDPITGEVLETEFQNGMGDVFRTKKVPAYHIAAYNKMGPLADASIISNVPKPKNMLTQEAASYLYKVDGTTEKVLNANITTWADFYNQNIWRKQSNYVWKGNVSEDGEYLSFDEYDWVNTSNNEPNGWVKTSEILKYNSFSMPLESEDINGIRSASKVDNMLRVESVASNSSYEEYSATGFESGLNDDNLSLVNGVIINSTDAHTGSKCLRINPGETGLKFSEYLFNKSGKQILKERECYYFSFWVMGSKQFNIEVEHSISWYNEKPEIVQIMDFGSWTNVLVKYNMPRTSPSYGTTLFQAKIKNTGSSTMYIDDFRFFPMGSSVSTYIYDEWDRLTYILDPNNIASKFEYNNAGQLSCTYKETPAGFKKVSEYEMNFARMNLISLVGLNLDFNSWINQPPNALINVTVQIYNPFEINKITNVKVEGAFGQTTKAISCPPGSSSHIIQVPGAINNTIIVSNENNSLKDVFEYSF